jgi:uncharacterized protein YcfJ
MNKSVIVGIVVGVALATAGGVFAGYRMLHDEDPGVAPTRGAEPVADAQESKDATESCTSEQPRDKKRVAGTVIGALVGGAVGNDVGDRKITTAAGAAAGAIAGNQIQKKIQEGRETNCTHAQ